MRSPPHSPERDFPWGCVLLALLGGACWIASLASPQRVTALLTQGTGATAAELAAMLPGRLRTAGTVLLLAAAVIGLFRQRIREWLQRAATILDRPCDRGTAERWWALAFIAGLVLLQDWPSLAAGYFESDDFTLLNDNRRLSLWELPQTTHNDHVIALLRLELRAMHAVFGVWAPAYNAAVMLSFVVMLWSGALLLIENGVQRLSTGVAVVLCGTWTAWGVFTTGGYILQAYMQIATCGALALYGWSRWQRLGRQRDLWLMVAATTVSVWLNISGFYVPCAVVAYAVLDAWSRGRLTGLGQELWKGRVAIGALLVAVVAAAAFTAWAYSRPESSGMLALAHRRHTPETFVWQLASFLGTLILSLVIPLPHHLARVSLLVPVVGGALLVGLGAMWLASRALDPARRALLWGLVVTLLGVGAMTCLGRPAFEFDMIWPAKYTGPGVFWLSLAIAPVADGLRERLASVSRIGWLKIALLVAGTVTAAQFTADAICASGLAFFQYDMTRRSALHEHRREHAAVRQLANDLSDVFAIPGTLAIPNLDGGLICRKYPELAFTWGEQPSLAVLAEVITSDPGRVDYLERADTPRRRERSMRIVESVRSATTGEFLSLLESNPQVRDWWLGPATIRGRPVEQPPADHSARELARALVETLPGNREAGEWVLPDGAEEWDPEQRPIVWLRLEDLPDSEPIELVVEFDGAQFGRSPSHTIVLNGDAAPIGQIDLLQLNGYALESHVRNLRFRMRSTGPQSLDDHANAR